MQQQPPISLSNRVEVLYDILIAQLYTESHPFSKRVVIVPSPAMKSWLTVKMANDPRLKICTGIEIHYLDDGLNLIYAQSTKNISTQYSPSSTELSLKIEVELKNIIQNLSNLQTSERDSWRPLINYLKTSQNEHLSVKSERRLILLSEKLAHLFQQYGRYGASMLEKWENRKEDIWQAQLWRTIYCNKKSTWTYPYKQYREYTPSTKHKNIQLHLFAVSYLSKLQSDFLRSLAREIPVYNYFISPCSLFWSDVRSDKERVLIQNHWNKNKNAAQQDKTLDELLRDRNRLLANFGRLGREIALTIEESDSATNEYYVAHSRLSTMPAYSSLYHEELYTDASSQNFTLLHAIQSDMLAMRTVDPEETIEIGEDHSIQIHVAPNKLREVQILHDNLMRIIDTHSEGPNPINPRDIIVLTPDILEYEPYIKSVFGGEDSSLDCQIMDLKIPAQSRLIQAFLHILSLPESRWDSKIILELFEYQSFQQKHNLSFDDVQTIRLWIKKSGILWGENAAHRDEILRRNHCYSSLLDRRNFGTWEHGLCNLIRSIAISGDISIDQSQSHLLGKFTEIIHSLRSDLKPLTDGSSMEISEWVHYLECILNSYLSIDLFDRAQESEYRQLSKTLENIGKAANWVGGEKFRFVSIKKRIEKSLLQEHVCYRENHIQSVKFCSMLPMRAIPSRAVAILGMEEGAYPKQEMYLNLNELNGREDTDFCPKQVDYDRYLFLEVILSAREYLLLSYSALSIDDGKEQAPSLLIDELLSYLDEGYRVDGKYPSEHCIIKHPFYDFNHCYFSPQAAIKSYSHTSYLSAVAYYSSEKKESHRFIHSFAVQKKSTQPSELHVTTRDLSNCIRNPLRAYFNNTLGMYIRSENDLEIKTEEDFVLSALENAILSKKSLVKPLEEVIDEASDLGKLPYGLFGEVASEKLKSDSQIFIDNMTQLGISISDIFTIQLSEHCEIVSQIENGVLTLPAIEYKDVVITGSIEHVCKNGLIAFADDRPEDIIKFWPEYVLLNYLIHRDSLKIENQIIPIKNKKGALKEGCAGSTQIHLQNLIDLYTITISNPSPLIPDWIPDIINGDEKALEITFDKTLYNSFKPIYNDYLLWITPSNQQPNSKEIIDHWTEYARRFLSAPYLMWYPNSININTEKVSNE